MYRAAHARDEKVIFYLDSAGNKYAASGGSLAWRLNNPGLVHRSDWFSREQNSLGHFSHYAIFSNPEKGRAALAIRIFTFGGGSFIAPGTSHSDSHNYASAADFVCRLGSPNLQLLALRCYYAHKEGLTDSQMIEQWSFQDAILYLDSTDAKVIQSYTDQRIQHYQNELSRINNLTILDPDPDSQWKHRLSSDCYQATIGKIIHRYRKKS